MAIDRPSRDHLAALLTRLADGELSRDAFREQRPQSKDRAVREIGAQGWLLFDDAREDAPRPRNKLTRDDRRDVARWILFLQSDRDYRWPALPAWARFLGLVPSILTFGLFWRPYRYWFERQGDFRVWPFQKRSELTESRRATPSAKTAARK